MTGYFFLDEQDYQPPVELSSFLENGKPPVCISFGSMVNRHADKIDRIIGEALNRTNNRGIILSGWGGVKQRSNDDLLSLESAPHDWLFPKCKMVIHHGGAGTTSAGLRAGIPAIVIPFTADQPFWGNRVHSIGVGPKPIRVNQLSVEKMVNAIAEAESKTTLERAQATGRELRGEDGVAKAVGLIETHAVRFNESI